MRIFPATCLILASSIATLSADLYTSAGSGLWDANNTTTWNPVGNPQTGTTDSVSILTGHTVEFSGASGVGLSGSGDLGVSNDQSININGGILTQTPPNYWIRIGHETTGTLNINDGRFHFTNSTAAASPNLQIGIRGGTGIVKIGDGTGAPGSAVLNLRDIVDGTANGANVNMNLAANEGAFTPGAVGTIVINSDGLLEGDVRDVATKADPVIRVGQGSSTLQSSLTINAGGQFNAHGKVEIGAEIGANGLIRINGTNARMDMDGGEFDIGYNGTGTLIIENNGVYSRVNTAAERQDMLIGREGPGVGSVVVQSGGQLLRGSGSNVGDMRIGLRGTGSMTINDGGLVQNDSGNWDWIGQENGSHGTLTINTGGTFRTTAGSNFIIGVNAGSTGLVVVNGGMLDLQSSGAGDVRIAQNGDGTFRQVSGISNVRSMQLAENNGTGTFDLQGGDLTIRSSFFLGGASNTSVGTGTATATQSGGNLNVGGAFVVGLAPGHTASYTMTGGTITHTGSDTSVGESGLGTMHVGANATLNHLSGGQFFVGRNEGSSGTLTVDGSLTRSSLSDIRVGNGDSNGVDNTAAPGVLGGTGSITGGVRIGAHGTLTGGTLTTVGTLSLTGNLTFSQDGTLFANFGTTGNVDRISLTGTANIEGALLDGDWQGGIVGLASRYWLLVNDDIDPIFGTFANVSSTSPNSSLFPNADGWATIDGQEFAVFYSADFDTKALTGGNDLLLAAVPEPSASLLLGCGLALTFARRRRKNA